MGTKQSNIIIIGLSLCIAAAISYIKWKDRDDQPLRTNVFKVVGGWGYDILVNDKIVIHQVSVPVLKNKMAFSTKEQAEQTAALVIKKLKEGQPPTLTKPDLKNILSLSEIKNGE